MLTGNKNQLVASFMRWIVAIPSKPSSAVAFATAEGATSFKAATNALLAADTHGESRVGLPLRDSERLRHHRCSRIASRQPEEIVRPVAKILTSKTARHAGGLPVSRIDLRVRSFSPAPCLD